jgi:hypothetical protein
VLNDPTVGRIFRLTRPSGRRPDERPLVADGNTIGSVWVSKRATDVYTEPVICLFLTVLCMALVSKASTFQFLSATCTYLLGTEVSFAYTISASVLNDQL